jgi:L-alanine-DL-glutamate epimerase-like enolase superfamily enzyme
LKLSVTSEAWPIAGTFRISRGAKTEALVVVCTVTAGGVTGRGECVPYARYGESVEGVIATLEAVAGHLYDGIGPEAAQALLPAGAARNALDCALWDLRAKALGVPAWQLAGLPRPGQLVTAYTLSLDTPEKMGEAARAVAAKPLLKLKLGGEGDIARVEAVRAAAPAARLVVDANEAWTPEQVEPFTAAMARLGVELIEQPLPAGADAALAGLTSAVPLCADESCHDRAGLAALVGRYTHINVKLDKTGGLTEAIQLARTAQSLGLGLMVGCMVGTSLAMAPAALLGGMADFVDLDGPLLLARDRDPAIHFDGSVMQPPPPALWG